MARDSAQQTTKASANASLKPGSNPEDAHKVGGKGDFGPAGGDGRTADRDYVSRNTKASDPGNAQPWANEQDAVRDHGAGGHASGPGSSSGGDLDPDVVGVGAGGSGVSLSGKVGRPPGPDDTTGSTDEFASGGHAQGRNQPGGPTAVRGTTHSADRDASTGDVQGASAVTNPVHELGGDVKHAPHDGASDAFAGEISQGEAEGDDNASSTADDRADGTP
jgi:hypothetical protein